MAQTSHRTEALGVALPSLDADDLRLVLDQLPVAVAVLAADGETIYQNRSATRLLGTRRLRADDLDHAQAEGDQGTRPETLHLFHDNVMTPVEVWAASIEGGSAHTAAVLLDVTERQRTERLLAETHADLARKAAVLERSNAELEAFAYVASHDLAEPLRVISGYVELLGRRYQGRLDDDADEFIAFAIEGCARMRQLIDDLLHYSRLAWSEPDLGAVDCAAVVANALRRLGAQVEEAAADVVVGPLPAVVGDEQRITALFQNLIGNALKFHDPAVAARVEITAERDGGGWCFTVADNGIGIEPAFHERAFGMFRRLHSRDLYSGTGIGLALCRKIVERHDGRIWIESDGTGGTRVRFTLPDRREA